MKILAALLCLSTSLLQLQTSVPDAQAVPASDVEDDPLPRGSSILFIGDSLAQGMKRKLSENGRKEGYRMYSETERGTRIDQWSKRAKKMLEERSPELVVISLGANDAFLKQPDAQRVHTKKLVEEVVSRGARLVWILPPPLPRAATAREKIIHIIKEEVAGAGAVFESDTAIFDRNIDGIHFSATGYEKWADLVWSFLKSKSIVH